MPDAAKLTVTRSVRNANAVMIIRDQPSGTPASLLLEKIDVFRFSGSYRLENEAPKRDDEE